jgi:serine phosphatase RsbU (regulator of sigma subunit)
MSPGWAVVIVALAGVVITASVTWTAVVLDRNNERHLLEFQSHQAASVLAGSIVSLEAPLETALQVASATGGDTAQVARQLAVVTGTGAGSPFVSASLWERRGSTVAPVVSVGEAPRFDPSSAGAQAFVTRAFERGSFVVAGVPSGDPDRVAYAVAAPGDPTYAVYAERAIPTDRRVPVESTSAFAGLEFATYLGATTDTSDLATTDVPPGQLPLTGDTVREAIPFGDTDLTLVTSPQGPLGGTLGFDLPWILLVGGLLLTAATAAAAALLVRRRRDAERDARTIAGLYDRLDTLFGEQRSIAETLQRALLPAFLPEVPGLESAARYVAGAAGVDIGGDWYSLIPVDEHRFGFVVGDVMGRGVGAATIMARLRFTLRAYLVEGHPPEVALSMCSRHIDITTDEHFSTVLVGVADRRNRTVTLANAGHLAPLVVDDGGAAYVATPPGLPLGVRPTTYRPTTLTMAPGSTFLAFTDGLVERRGELIDVRLDRLARAAAVPAASLDGLLTALLVELVEDGAEDDIAILAFRWADDLPAGDGVSWSGR